MAKQVQAEPTRIAAVRGADTAVIQELIAAAARTWRKHGLRVVGVIEESTPIAERVCHETVLRDVATGRIFPISQNLGPGSQSCNLDSYGLAAACAAVEEAVRAGCDLVVLSKFGKQEAAGGGLVDAFGAAIAADVPVLTSVSSPVLVKWLEFAGPLAEFLPPEARRIADWLERRKRCVQSPV